MHALALDGLDHHAVQPDRVGAIRGAGAEHPPLRGGRIVARMYPQDVSAGAVEPGEQQQLVTGADAVEALDHRRVELEPGVRGAFVALLRRPLWVDQRGLDPPDRT